ncbi:hypothetical protein BDZ91DRAFT_779715 [Kalaharituber pfeilii]|nr:hypothetical protein BDZ91DRAFT_779715 [Kalaharituber pfeilii]
MALRAEEQGLKFQLHTGHSLPGIKLGPGLISPSFASLLPVRRRAVRRQWDAYYIRILVDLEHQQKFVQDVSRKDIILIKQLFGLNVHPKLTIATPQEQAKQDLTKKEGIADEILAKKESERSRGAKRRRERSDTFLLHNLSIAAGDVVSSVREGSSDVGKKTPTDFINPVLLYLHPINPGGPLQSLPSRHILVFIWAISVITALGLKSRRLPMTKSNGGEVMDPEEEPLHKWVPQRNNAQDTPHLP